MRPVHINALDLNLLRLFDAIGRTRNVSRAAELLDITQPAASQGLARLRTLLHDPLFVRAGAGVRPTPKAEALGSAVREALGILEQALNAQASFDPASARQVFRLHLSDIGEARFLPELMAALLRAAPGVRVETMPLPAAEIAPALDDGRIDLAFGFLPQVQGTEHVALLRDRYIVLLREGHPLLRTRRKAGDLQWLRELELVAVRTHSDTLRILELLQLQDRLRLTTHHFLVLPAIVRATDLAVVMPRNIALGFAEQGGYALVEPALPLAEFTVSLHWSRRHASEPARAWLRQFIVNLFATAAA
ncbi:LysR substrate-binding domain-containing protein [Pseudorhodoferax sp. Leaf265]|uniref:LysR substrate-binding domain-containing protein n=1 Tax=Pseudorhodoferax sp. Leaf265 TaxID=1736315 RepID=UPI0006F572A3|nr:LysR substrate-binding domain-containing protein [Pseudorhodoferax sp. Leaf265]KQP19825.1 LysR family transcriptional regulator [Pseudorhodoferax sp. Leaf265]